MPKFDFYPSFNAGEVSPFIDARTSLEKYRSACRTLENFQILPYGGVIRRPGTEFRGTTKNPNLGEVRLIGFNFSTTTRFIIEAGVGYMRFWSGATGAPVTVATPGAWATGNIYSVGNYVREASVTYYCTSAHTSGTFATDLAAGKWVAQTILEVPTPYTAMHLREVQFAQINDIMYFAHANYPPRKLSRLADNNWTFAPVVFDYPPLQETNTTENVISWPQVPYIEDWQAGNEYEVGDFVKPPAWAASTVYAVGDIVLSSNIAYRCATAHTSPATFAATNWTAQNQTSQSFYYYAMSAHRAGSNFGVDEAAAKWILRPLRRTEKFVLTGVGVSFQPAMKDSQLELKFQASSYSLNLPITASSVSETIEVEGGWDFTTNGIWDADIQLLRVNSEVLDQGYITARANKTATINGTNTQIDVVHPFHGWQSGNKICVGKIWAPSSSNYQTHESSIFNITTNGYSYYVPTTSFNAGDINAGQAGWLDIFPENLSKMEIIREYRGQRDFNTVASGTESVRVGLKIRVIYRGHGTQTSAGTPSATTSPQARLDPAVSLSSGIVTVLGTGQTGSNGGGSNYVLVKVNTWLGSTQRFGGNTKFFSFGSFSGGNGYPRSVAMHEQRLCFGGTSSQPNTIWCSQIDNFENFKTGVTASDAVQFTLAASEGNRINWMYSQSQLLIGTSGDEWTIGSADSSASLSATNVQASRQSSYGSKYMRAALVNDVLLFVQRNGRKVRELVYELNKDGWVAPDLTLLAEHITSGEIVEVAYQQQPDAVLWCVRGDGTLIAMTYERDQKVVGWHRHVIADNADVESVATIYGNGTEDEVWMAVKRTVSGQTYRTIERFPLLWRKYLDEETAASWRYLDGWSAFTSGAANRTISLLDRFNGKTVTVVQEGQSPITRTVASGAITVPAASAGYVGLPYTSTLTPMKLDMDLEDGSSQGRKKRIHKIIARLYKSRGGEISTNNGQWYALADTLSTGDQKMILAGAFGFDADVTLRQTAPYPMAVIALQPVWDTFGNE